LNSGLAQDVELNDGTVRTVKGIFHKAYREAELMEMGVSASSPYVKIATSDLGAVTSGSTATINGTVYTVTEVQNRGNALTILVLSYD